MAVMVINTRVELVMVVVAEDILGVAVAEMYKLVEDVVLTVQVVVGVPT